MKTIGWHKVKGTFRPRAALFAGFASALLCAGCATPNPKPADPELARFKEDQPREAAAYTHLYAVNLENYKVLDQLRSDKAGDIIVVMKQKFPEVTEFGDYADRLLKTDDEMWKNVERNVAELGEACAPGSALYEFEWNNGIRVETGLLILKSGKIAKREVWTSHDVNIPAAK
jgi:hypothetical protein